MSDKGNFDDDRWELYHVDEDRSESTNVAEQYPDKLKELIDAWYEEAKNNFVLPLDDRIGGRAGRHTRARSPNRRATATSTTPTPPRCPRAWRSASAAASYKIVANVDLSTDAQGVIFAHGSRFGGHTLFIKDGRLHYVYNFLGIKPEQDFVSPPLTPGKHSLGMEFKREKAGEHGESLGKTMLYVDGKPVAEGPMRAQIGKFTLAGDGLCVGYDSGDNVSEQYKNPGNVHRRHHPGRRLRRQREGLRRSQPRRGGGFRHRLSRPPW